MLWKKVNYYRTERLKPTFWEKVLPVKSHSIENAQLKKTLLEAINKNSEIKNILLKFVRTMYCYIKNGCYFSSIESLYNNNRKINTIVRAISSTIYNATEGRINKEIILNYIKIIIEYGTHTTEENSVLFKKTTEFFTHSIRDLLLDLNYSESEINDIPINPNSFKIEHFFHNLDMRGIDLSGCQIGAKSYTILNGLSFHNTNLTGANFERANLTQVDFEGANLQGVNIKGANLKDANLNGAKLDQFFCENINHEYVNVFGTDLTNYIDTPENPLQINNKNFGDSIFQAKRYSSQILTTMKTISHVSTKLNLLKQFKEAFDVLITENEFCEFIALPLHTELIKIKEFRKFFSGPFEEFYYSKEEIFFIDEFIESLSDVPKKIFKSYLLEAKTSVRQWTPLEALTCYDAIMGYKYIDDPQFYFENSGFISQLIFFLKKPQYSMEKKAAEIEKKYIYYIGKFYPKLKEKLFEILEIDDHGMGDSLIFFSPEKRDVICIGHDYYKSNLLQESNSYGIGWFNLLYFELPQTNTCSLEMSSMNELSEDKLLDIFSRITLFKDNYTKELEKHMIFKFFEKLNLGNYLTSIKAAFGVWEFPNESVYRFNSKNNLEKFTQLISLLYTEIPIKGEPISQRLQLSEFFFSLKIFNENLILDNKRKSQVYVCFVSVLTRLSSVKFLGTEDYSVVCLRHLAAAMLNKAMAWDSENINMYSEWVINLTTDVCSISLFDDMNDQLKKIATENPQFKELYLAIIPTAWQ